MIPSWFSSQNKAIAQALLDYGFWHVGMAADYVIFEECLSPYQGWQIGPAYQDQLTEAVHDGVLFCAEPNFDDFEDDLEVVKGVIREAISKWEEEIGQLTLDLAL